MTFIGESRESDSPFVDSVWQVRSEGAGAFISGGSNQWEMVIQRNGNGSLTMAVRGPETIVTEASYPDEGEWLGITFHIGTHLAPFPIARLVNQSIELPAAGDRSFWLHGAAWPYPDLANADDFVARLVREGLLIHDPLIPDTLAGYRPELSERSLQRRFLRATGLTQATLRQIERAHHAMALLQTGTSILDTVDAAGYYDQPHLTRALKRWLGRTPAQLIGTE